LACIDVSRPLLLRGLQRGNLTGNNPMVLRLSRVSVALAGFSALLLLSAGMGSADAVVYCKTVGVPQGCVVRPVAPVTRAVVAPVAVVTPVVVTPRVGVGVVGVPGNRGGPVNRVGRR
jgi:hypothetical protein